MLKGGNLIPRKHIFLLEIKYFCKLKELPWAELSPNYVSLFVEYFDKHIRGDALIFMLNLITSRPKFTRTRSPPDETLTYLFHWEQSMLNQSWRASCFACAENEPPLSNRWAVTAVAASCTRATVRSGYRYHRLGCVIATDPQSRSYS